VRTVNTPMMDHRATDKRDCLQVDEKAYPGDPDDAATAGDSVEVATGIVTMEV
jgi:hypothetical protein